MAKNSMKNIWNDRRREDERLQKLAARKRPLGAEGVAVAAAENPTEQKPEDKQVK